MNLLESKLQNEYIIIEISNEDKEDLKKICSLGILPGLHLKVVQKSPMLIFEVYNSRFAIDNKLAKKIIIKPIENKN